MSQAIDDSFRQFVELLPLKSPFATYVVGARKCGTHFRQNGVPLRITQRRALQDLLFGIYRQIPAKIREICSIRNLIDSRYVTQHAQHGSLRARAVPQYIRRNISAAEPLSADTPTLSTYGPSHDNAVVGNVSHTDGPTGGEKKAGVVPAFLGGFVVLNGTYNNQILNNQDWASTGNGFVWAQAVPNSGTPIGVSNYPPVIHCNVTASEGGAGVANLNGNVWQGNSFQRIDACIPPQ